MPIDGRPPKTPQPDPTPLGRGQTPRGIEPSGTAGAIPCGTMEPSQLRAVLHRLSTGFYDRADVRDQIAARVRADLP